MPAPDLELISLKPSQANGAPPLLLLHGAFAGAWCWQGVQAQLAAAGYTSHALSLRGHGQSSGFWELAHNQLGDYLADVRQALAQIGEPCILLGHSLGGYLAQEIARATPPKALILLASIPPYGLAGSLQYMSTVHPQLLLGLQGFALGHTTQLDAAMLRHLLFAPETPMLQVEAFASRAQPESMAALGELWLPQWWKNWPQAVNYPVWVLGAEHDNIIPWSDVALTAQAWGVSAERLPAAGHAMMWDSSAAAFSARLCAWLGAQRWD
ncbi:alpha/beta fold hydrolase [Chitinibacter sp. ZOR0017]|uniref:alpha/beta fold hydrolase n=1 Tax=Chitinibacter sp. ZOR0017 TaxID=1339254 RepID=UPI000647F257|nr:alpha/beta fold hydrolase [Chitinibacter sp. ZOR0017]